MISYVIANLLVLAIEPDLSSYAINKAFTWPRIFVEYILFWLHRPDFRLDGMSLAIFWMLAQIPIVFALKFYKKWYCKVIIVIDLFAQAFAAVLLDALGC